jgi:hypothetical protein
MRDDEGWVSNPLYQWSPHQPGNADGIGIRTPTIRTTTSIPHPPPLRGLLDAGGYPDTITTARLDIRWFTTGDFSVHYVEEHEDVERWECRWDRDRDPDTHDTRLHLHKPPTATEITDLELPSLHPLDVYFTVFTTVEQRIETL